MDYHSPTPKFRCFDPIRRINKYQYDECYRLLPQNQTPTYLSNGNQGSYLSFNINHKGRKLQKEKQELIRTR